MVQSKRKNKSSEKSKPSTSSSQSEPVDQTEKVHSLQENDYSREDIFNEIQDYAIIMMDVKGNITSWNKGATKIKGYTAKEIIGKNYRIFYTREDKQLNLSEKLLEVARKKGRTSYEGWRVRKDGTRFWGSMTLTALHDAQGKIKGYLKVTRDLTDKKIAEDSLSNFIEELKLKNEALRESEEKYHNMVAEVSDYAIILLDRHGKILDWNKGAEKLKGYSSGEIVGKNFRLFYAKSDKDQKLPERLLAEAEKRGSVIHEGWRIRKDGKRFWGNVTITALHDQKGRVIGFSKVTRDLTERKIAEDKVGNLIEELRQANDQLRESEQQYQKMISEVQDYAIILLDTEGNIQNWNNGAQLIKGYAPKEIVGKNFRIFYCKEDRAKQLPEQLIAEAALSGKVTHEGWRLRKDGTKFWGSVVITALHNSARQVIGFSKVTRDLTERKAYEDSLKASAAQLDLKNKSLERLNGELASFTNVASHDLKEPIRKIRIFAKKIKDLLNDQTQVDGYADKIIDSSLRMQHLIEALLSFSQATEGSGQMEDVNLNEIVATVKSDLEILITEKKASVQTNKLPVVKGIPHQMHQVFLNLISNALKFSKPDEAPVISIEARRIKGPDIPGEIPDGGNRYYQISVKDNGIGFEAQHSSKIFNAFYRLHTKEAYNGTGLGLAIVKKIIQNHNGLITTDSEPGRGSVFNIYLPFGRM
jgi:PAS domain S-box-containing protein